MTTLTGKISWFGGSHDATSGPTTASGAPVSRPGIAIYNRATLGGWWLITMPNGTRAVLQQTDIGPAPWTGRKIDFTSAALAGLGYSEQSFPTNAIASASYLGKSVPASLRGLVNGTPAPTAASASSPAPSVTSTSGSGLGGWLARAGLTAGLLAGGVALTGLGTKLLFAPLPKPAFGKAAEAAALATV